MPRRTLGEDRRSAERRPWLELPHDEVRQKIQTQIDQGEKLLAADVSDVQTLDQLSADLRTWRDYNTELLAFLFDSDRVSREYVYRRPRWGVAESKPQLESQIVKVRESYSEDLKRLASLIGSLNLYHAPEPVSHASDPSMKGSAVVTTRADDLLPEQEELLASLVEAIRHAPQRQPFTLIVTDQADILQHPGLPNRNLTIYLGDFKALERAGLIVPVRGHQYDLTPAGYARVDEIGRRSASQSEGSRSSAAPTRKRPDAVFVIHGRNEQARRTIFALLRAADLKPLEFEQARRLTGQASPYVGDILSAAFAYAQAIVVLLTDDERQISDLTGRHVVRWADGAVISRKRLLERLRDSGCSVDMSGEDWLTVVG